MPVEPVPYLTGATASGKSAVALLVARDLGGELVSADSRQVYRELTIGTEKPSGDERAAIRHHLVDCRSVAEPLSAGAFARLAKAAVDEVRSRGRRPIVVGGSTLYLHALVFGLADIPSVDPAIRARLADRLRREGPERLHAELSAVDPDFASTLDATKTQRLLRGLEVFEGTGRPISSFFAGSGGPDREFDVVALRRERDDLYRRIDRRVTLMVDGGLIDEARALAAAGIDLDAHPIRTIGYHETAGYLRGEYGREELVRRIRRNSRRYAKRQLTWLRRYPGIEWIDHTGRDAADVASILVRRWAAATPHAEERANSMPTRLPPSS